MTRVAFATLGCRLNQVDSQQLQAALEARGFSTVPFGAAADVVVVNTCTVTARAEVSDRQAIRRARRANPDARVVVTGCWAQTSAAPWCPPPTLRAWRGPSWRSSTIPRQRSGGRSRAGSTSSRATRSRGCSAISTPSTGGCSFKHGPTGPTS